MKEITYYELYEEGKKKLSEAGIREYEHDARDLMLYAFDMTMSDMLINYMTPIYESDMKLIIRYRDMIDKRADHIPLQHITHEQCICGYMFYTDERALIPRLDTEILIEEAVKDIKKAREEGSLGSDIKLLDMCTGTGCIAIALSDMADIKDVTVTDISEDALDVARCNIDRCHIDRDSYDIKIIKSDLWDELDDKTYDIITCNPPYIRSDIIDELSKEVKDHDPRIALDGGTDGLCIYRRLISELSSHISDGGYFYTEIGYDQASDIKKMLDDIGMVDIKVIKDLAGLDRIVKARSRHV